MAMLPNFDAISAPQSDLTAQSHWKMLNLTPSRLLWSKGLRLEKTFLVIVLNYISYGLIYVVSKYVQQFSWEVVLGILSGAGDVTEGESPLREASCGWNDLSRLESKPIQPNWCNIRRSEVSFFLLSVHKSQLDEVL